MEDRIKILNKALLVNKIILFGLVISLLWEFIAIFFLGFRGLTRDGLLVIGIVINLSVWAIVIYAFIFNKDNGLFNRHCKQFIVFNGVIIILSVVIPTVVLSLSLYLSIVVLIMKGNFISLGGKAVDAITKERYILKNDIKVPNDNLDNNVVNESDSNIECSIESNTENKVIGSQTNAEDDQSNIK
jgi:hypothetical protein